MNTESDNGVLVFVKYPTPGMVKTRLAEELGGERVAELYKRFVTDILDTLGELDVRLKILFSPPDAEQEFRLWLGDEYTYAAQDGEGLGQRMKNALGDALANGFNKALLVGSDSPDIPGDYVKEAFSSLDNCDAVIGPSSDGGYYLIGFSRESFLPEAFDGIDWSTPVVLEQTVARLEMHGRKIHLLEQWYDVDTLADLEALTRRKLKAHF
jgi:rSAM/selenodomain-associated transferase 1